MRRIPILGMFVALLIVSLRRLRRRFNTTAFWYDEDPDPWDGIVRDPYPDTVSQR